MLPPHSHFSVFFFFTIFSFFLALSSSQCTGTANSAPIIDANLTRSASITNATLYSTTVGGVEVPILHVYGSPYELGYAQGSIQKEAIQAMYPLFFKYLDEQIDPYLKDLPKFLRRMIENFGIDAALEYTAMVTKKYTPDHFFQEMQGLADGAGVPYRQVLHLHMFPEVIKAACSMYGAWGNAVNQTTGTLYQLRALDWGLTSPLGSYPQVTVYHPTQGKPFLNVGWTGFIGSITGYAEKIGICEKVWLSYNGTYSRAGVPFHFLLRDILQFDDNIQQAVDRISNATRTCSIFVGLGDDSQNEFRVVHYAHQYYEVFDPETYPKQYHPYFPDIVYVDKHKQPSANPCLPSLIEQYYGTMDINAAVQIAALLQTGDLHAAFYDYKQNKVYFSIAEFNPSEPESTVAAYDRQWVGLDVGALFAESQ